VEIQGFVSKAQQQAQVECIIGGAGINGWYDGKSQ
jgi:hypothetical protein